VKSDYPEIVPIDHALLTPTAMPEQVQQWLMRQTDFSLRQVCVYPALIRQAAELLRGKQPKVCTVIGFPFEQHQ